MSTNYIRPAVGMLGNASKQGFEDKMEELDLEPIDIAPKHKTPLPPPDDEFVLKQSPEAMKRTRQFEGFRPYIYKDTKGKRTIGTGYNIDDPTIAALIPADVLSGKRELTKQEDDAIFPQLYKRAQSDAYDVIGAETYKKLPPAIQDIVVDMSYNLGRNKFAGFKESIKALQQNDYKKFGEEIKDSLWYNQVGDRSKTHYKTIQQYLKMQPKKESPYDLFSAANPFHTPSASADEIPAGQELGFEGLDLEPFEQQPSGPSSDVNPYEGLSLEPFNPQDSNQAQTSTNIPAVGKDDPFAQEMLAQEEQAKQFGQTMKTVGKGLGMGFASVVKAGGGLIDLVTQGSPLNKLEEAQADLKGEPVKPNPVTKAGENMQQTLMPDDPNNPGLVYEISAAFGSSLPFMVPGIGVAGAAIKGGMSFQKAASLASAFSAVLESGVEAGGVAQELAGKKSKEDINKAALATFSTNLPLLYATDKLGGLFDLGKKHVILKIGKPAFFEAGQEGGQEAISNVATDKPAGENVGKSAALGGLVGGSVAGIMHLATNQEPEVRSQREGVFQNFLKDMESGTIGFYNPDTGHQIDTTGQERRIFDTLVAEAEKTQIKIQTTQAQTDMITAAESAGKVIGIDADSKLPIIDTKQKQGESQVSDTALKQSQEALNVPKEPSQVAEKSPEAEKPATDAVKPAEVAPEASQPAKTAISQEFTTPTKKGKAKKPKIDADETATPEAIQTVKDMGLDDSMLEKPDPDHPNKYWLSYETEHGGLLISASIRKSDAHRGSVGSTSVWELKDGEGNFYRAPNFDTLQEVKDWIDEGGRATTFVLSDVPRENTEDLQAHKDYLATKPKLTEKEQVLTKAIDNQLKINKELGVEGPDPHSWDMSDGGTQELPVRLEERSAYLRDGTELRRTPPGQPTVSDILKPGMIVKTSLGDAPYIVVNVSKHTSHGLPVYSIGVADVNQARTKNGDFMGDLGGVNNLVAQDGKVFELYAARNENSQKPLKVLSEREAMKDWVDSGFQRTEEELNFSLPEKYKKKEVEEVKTEKLALEPVETARDNPAVADEEDIDDDLQPDEEHVTIKPQEEGPSDAKEKPAKSDERGTGGDSVRGGTRTGGISAVESGGDGRGSPAGTAGAEEIEPAPAVGNYRITDADALGEGGVKTKFRQNVDAIKLLKKIEEEKRQATPEEQKVLVKYTGWGALSKAFEYGSNDEWSSERRELSDLLSDEEYRAARSSTINAHYTSPEIIKAMWKAVTGMGFTRGKVLEPSSGVGHFVGLAPQSGKGFSLVELDSLTGRIAQQLYQGSNVQVKGLQEATLPANFFDLAISNVPFADIKPYDARAKALGIPSGLNLHDYFFAKSLAHVKPGGLIAFITSKGTMDKSSPDFRAWLNKNAKFIDAFRLPSNAFKKNAGTEVVTDIIFLQKPQAGEKFKNPDFLDVADLTIGGKQTPINSYFIEHPDKMLGKPTIERGLYREDEFGLTDTGEFTEKLNAAIASLPKDIFGANSQASAEMTAGETIEDANNVKNFAFVIENDKAYQKLDGKLVAQPIKGVDLERLKGIIGIRDDIRNLLFAERKDFDPNVIEALRKRLNKNYDSFVKKYDHLNTAKNESLFEDDPDSALVSTLENVKKTGKGTYSYTKNPIFTTRAIKPHVRPTTAASIKDALNISLGEYGAPNFKYMSELLGQSPENLEKNMLKEGLAFRDPNGETIVIRDEYLSGNVKAKLAEAESAAKSDPQYKQNVEELQKVQPKDLTFDQIHARIGMPWIQPDIYNQFLRALGARSEIFHNSATGSWEAETRGYDYSSGQVGEWSTPRMSTQEILLRVANGKPLKVFDKVKDIDGTERNVLNEEQTALAEQKADLMKEKFAQWFWGDDARREENVRYYNDHWNTTVVRKYDGSHLVFPGMNINAFPGGLRKTQKDAIWRGITTNRVMLAHSVGAGKTAIMTITAMESKRLGLVNKSMMVVPKNTVPGWRAQINLLYPAAKVLIATEKNFDTARRKQFLSKIATGDWDIVVIPETAFQKMQVSPETYEAFLNEEIDMLREAKEQMKSAGARVTVKNMEKAIQRKEEKLKEILDQSKRDDLMTFEELGVDSIFVDEADKFKNLAYITQKQGIKGMGSPEGSDKALDMLMKVNIIREGSGKIVFATGTPISNSMVEAYTMMRYLQPEDLQEHGMYSFDDWSNTFGEIDTKSEVDVTGGKYKIVSRFSRFVNVPELMKIIRKVWDIQTQEMLEQQGILVKGKNLPLIEGGKPDADILLNYKELQEYTATLVERAEAIEKRKGPVQKGDDILLTVLGDGKKAAIDIRTIDPNITPSGATKVEFTIKGVLDVYKKTKDVKGTQIIFIDKIAPDKTAAWNPHYYMKNKLIEGGIPHSQIAFIHDYTKDDQKDDLYQKMNNGEVRVLFGSTEKLGAGTNVQERLAGLWHLDVPWRPRDITQREGRIVRPGNINKVVKISRMAQKGSLDTFMYNLLEAKAKSIEQLLQGDETARTIDEGDVNEYEQLKALSSENPLVKEKADLDREVKKLKALFNAHLNERNAANKVLKETPSKIAEANTYLSRLNAFQKDIPKRPAKEDFSIKIGEATFTEKEKALEALWASLKNIGLNDKASTKIGEYVGYPLVVFKQVNRDMVENSVGIEIAKSPLIELMGKVSQDPSGTFLSLDNAIFGTRVSSDIDYYEKRIAALEKEQQYAQDLLSKPFAKQSDLDAKTVRQLEVNKELLKDTKDKPVKEPDVLASMASGRIDEYEKGPARASKKAAFKLSERVTAMVHKYAGRFGEGYTPRGAEGALYTGTGNIFVKAKNDISVAAHEVAHFLDLKYNINKRVARVVGTSSTGKPLYDPATRKIRKELTGIYTKFYLNGKKDHPVTKRVTEGLAIFVERMITHPTDTRKDFPLLHSTFLQPTGTFYDPILPEFIREMREIVEDYQNLSELDKVAARVVDGPVLDDNPFLNVQEKAIYHNIDNKYPLEKMAKESGEHFTANDPSLIARIYDHVPMIVQHNLSDTPFLGLGPWNFGKEAYLTMVEDGEIKKIYDFNWHTLVKKLGVDLEDFNAWLVARRVVGEFRKMVSAQADMDIAAKDVKDAQNAGMDPADEDFLKLQKKLDEATLMYQNIADLVARNGFEFSVAQAAFQDHQTRFADAADMYDSLVRADLDLANTAGFIKPKQYEEMTKETGYATFKRHIENEILGTGEETQKGRSFKIGGKKISSLMSYRGSRKDIISPLYSSMENHQEIMKKASKQMVYNSIARLTKNFPAVFQKLTLQVAKDPKGPIRYPQDKDPNIMMAFAEGKRTPYLVNKDVKAMIDNILTPVNVGLWEKIFVGSAQIFTKGTTAFYFPFAATNFVIDQLSAASNSWTKYTPIYTPIAELTKVLSNRQAPEAQFAMEYFMLGGERQAFLAFADLSPKEAYDFMRNEKNALQRMIDLVNRGTDLMAVPVKSTEILTRMSEFIRARREGYSQLAALELAGRISTPFHHRGQKSDIYRFLTRSIPYLNASIQVLAQEARSLKSPKTQQRALFMYAIVSTALIAGVLSAIGRGTDDQKRLLKALSVDQLARYVFFPHPNGKDLIKIRVPQEKGSVATLLNMAILDAIQDTDYSFYEYLRAATAWVPDQLNPIDPARMLVSWLPQAVSPSLQIVFNKRIYPKVRDLEPDFLKYLPKEERVFDTTSKAARFFGPKFGLSPIQFDALVEGYTGRSIRYVSGREIGNAFEQKFYLQSSRQLISFYETRAKNDEEYRQWKDRTKRFSDEESARIVGQHKKIEIVEKQLKEFRKMNASNKDDPDIRKLRNSILDAVDSIDQ